MDELNIQSKFLKGIIGKMIAKTLKKKLGDFDIVVDLNNFNVKLDDSKVYISAGVNATANKEIVSHLIKNAL